MSFDHPDCAALDAVRAVSRGDLRHWFAHQLQLESKVYSNGLAYFALTRTTNRAHSSVPVTGGGRTPRQVRGAR